MSSHTSKPKRCSTSSSTHPNQNVADLILPRFVVVMLHGLTMSSDECDKIRMGVEERFGKDAYTIQPKCRNGYNSVFTSMDKQAKLVLKEVMTNLTEKYPKYSYTKLKTLPMFLVGFSQGGMISMLIADTFRHELNIVGIVAIDSPLTGTQAFENSRKDLRTFQKRSKRGLRAIGHPTVTLIDVIALLIILNNPFVEKFTHHFFRGAKDMYSTSDVISRIKRFVRGGIHHIPTLLIATYIDDLNQYFDYDAADKDQVDEFLRAYTTLITKEDYGEHDFLISAKSQLCRTDSFESLVASLDDPVYPSNVRVHILRNLLHAPNMIPFLSKFQVKRGELCVESNKVITVITDFIEEQNRNLYRH